MSVRLARKYSDVDKKLSPLDRDDVFLQRFKIFWGLAVRSSTLCCRLKIRCKKCLPLIHTRIGKHHSVHTPHIGMVRQILRILLLVTYYTILVGSFIVPLSQLPTQRSTPRKTVDRTSKYSDTKFQDIHYRYKAFITEAEEEESTDVNCWTRRWVLTCGLALVSTIPTGVGATTPSGLREVEPAEAATATEAPGEVSVNRGEADEIADEGPNFDALVDLPPVTEGCVRLFLCRHGQTENNRLRKVQGARVDISINENGIEQAKNLGQALKRILPMKPKEFFSSKLIRARMTAEIAKSMVMTQENGQEEGKITSVKQLDSLGEVDFGPIAEGRPIALAKAGMQATYAVWATGNVDYRPEGGEGESGREVLQRAASSLAYLARAAAESKEGVCVAVTHSTYLRMLLALALDVPLLEVATYAVVNGGVSVIDIPTNVETRRLGKKSRLFSGPLQQEGFELDVPICHVIRINEARHLPTKPVLV